MRFILALIVFVAVGWPITTRADPIQDVISSQIEAFKADDFDKAFSYASPMIKGIFGSADRFGMMVQRGYPMVWRPADVQFVGQEERDGFTYQSVQIRDADGVSHTLEYQMLQSQDDWVINGVQFVQAPGVSA